MRDARSAWEGPVCTAGGFCLDMARQPGAAAALSKPFSNDVLIRAVDVTLNRSTPATRLSVATTA